MRCFHVAIAWLTLFAVTTAFHAEESRAGEKVSFERQQFDVVRSRGKILIAGQQVDRPLTEQPTYIALIESFDQLKFTDDRDFLSWANKLRGKRTYTYDIVIERNEDGSTSRSPLVLLPAAKRSVIDPLWRSWLAERQAEADLQRKQQLADDAERKRWESQQRAIDAIAYASRATADSLALASGETSLWEVELVPRGGTSAYAFPYGAIGSRTITTGIGIRTGLYQSSLSGGNRYVRVFARDSLSASNQAVADHPGYVAGAVRKLAGY